MKIVIQRVSSATVDIKEKNYTAQIKQGLLILLGVEAGDTEAEIKWGAQKCAALRIFEDEAEKMNLSVKDIDGSCLVISQFTLAGDCKKGNRPSFVNAAQPEIAEPLYDKFCVILEREHGVPVKKGIFRTTMSVSLTNEGPVTIILERSPKVRSCEK